MARPEFTAAPEICGSYEVMDVVDTGEGYYRVTLAVCTPERLIAPQHDVLVSGTSQDAGNMAACYENIRFFPPGKFRRFYANESPDALTLIRPNGTPMPEHDALILH